MSDEEGAGGLARRRLLQLLVGGSGLAAAGMIGVPIVTYLLPPAPAAADTVVSLPDGEIPAWEVRRIAVAGRPVLVLNTGHELRAFSAVCTHMGCVVKWSKARRQFLCPCHGARFDADGNVRGGPAPRPLARLELTATPGRIAVRAPRAGAVARRSASTPEPSTPEPSTPETAELRAPALRTWIARRTGAPVRTRGPRAHGCEGQGGLSLGVVLVFAFGLQLATGTLLLLHFVPDPAGAFESVRALMRDVPFGWLIRLLHAHGGNLLVAIAFVHLFHTAFAGAYRDPRELVWVSGCALFAGVLAAALTGYVLPWSQMSYWATTVVTASAEYVPGIGGWLVRALRGGELVGEATFRRAFAAHVALLPLLLLAGVAVHLALVRRLARGGGVAGTADAAKRPAPGPASDGTRRAIAIVAFLLLLFACVFFAPNLFLPAAHRVPADPFETPPDVKPEWYFLWSYALSRLVPGGVALLLQLGALGLLVALPFLDRGKGTSPRERAWVLAAIASSLLALIALCVSGHLA